ncbi:MAG: hypothetical protein GX436_05765 [Synergistaceae bacterium]|nr:hypothetical protein [Synergistaceae bacterium]
MKFRRNLLHLVFLVVILSLSLAALLPRWKAERMHRNFAMVVESSEILSLSRQEGRPLELLLAEMKEQKLEGIVVNELTGLDLLEGQSGFLFGPLARIPEARSLFPGASGDLAVIAFSMDRRWSDEATSYLKAKFPDLLSNSTVQMEYLLLPRSAFELEKAGVVPDFEGLDLARKAGLPVLFRPVPCPGAGGGRVVSSLQTLADRRPEIRGILPQGLFVPGAPDIQRIGEWIREKGLFLAQAEFSRQYGAERLNRSSYPALVPIHSVTTDEILVKRISRDAIVERMVRAFVERSVPLLLIRSYEIEPGGRYAAVLSDMNRIREDLERRGYRSGWPEPIGDWPNSPAGASAYGLAVALLCVRLFLRFSGKMSEPAGWQEAAVLLAGGTVLAFLMLRLPLAARLTGAFGSAFLAAEVCLWALGEVRKPVFGLLGALLLTITGGLALAAFFSTPMTMLRLQPFSGVKMTLLLPPILVLAHDFLTGVAPESPRKLLARPMVWLEFLLVCVILLAAGVLALRSDNTAFVGGWERTLRDLLERALVARPRTKELFIGYPALILWYAMARANWGRQAWILPRVAASIGFASAVNSFCHFHTRLPFILFRVFNGWWTGIAMGMVLICLLKFGLLPLVSRWRPVRWN